MFYHHKYKSVLLKLATRQAAEKPYNIKAAHRKHSAKKMPNDEEDGMQMLFRMPDLVDKLLPFLDPSSTLCLAKSKISCVLQILQHRSVPWDKMVRRTLSGNFQVQRGILTANSGRRGFWQEMIVRIGWRRKRSRRREFDCSASLTF